MLNFSGNLSFSMLINVMLIKKNECSGKTKVQNFRQSGFKTAWRWAVSCLFTSLIWNLTYFTSYTYEWVILNATKNQYELCYCLSLTCYWGFSGKMNTQLTKQFVQFSNFLSFSDNIFVFVNKNQLYLDRKESIRSPSFQFKA